MIDELFKTLDTHNYRAGEAHETIRALWKSNIFGGNVADPVGTESKTGRLRNRENPLREEIE